MVWVAVLVVASTHLASAQPVSPADDAFQRGRDLLSAGKYEEACSAFETSQRLDPQLATQFNIALCDEQLGKLASALVIHREIAAHDDNPGRRARSAEIVIQLGSRVPRLRIDVAENRTRFPPMPEVTVNGARVTNFKDLPVDLGVSRVVARAPGYLDWTGQIVAKDEKQRLFVTIILEPDPDVTPADPTTPPDTARPSTIPRPTGPSTSPLPTGPIDDPGGSGRGGSSRDGSSRRKYAVITLAAGGAAIAGGIGFGLLARSKWNDAKHVCGGTTCPTQDLLEQGQSLTNAARTRGNVSTALVIVGGALAVGGAVLWVTAPKAERSLALAPSASPTAAGVAIVGRF